MADATPKPAAKVGKKKSNRLVIVFEGRFADLLPKIEAQALKDDRDVDTVVLRMIESSLAAV
jgi:hypothetical protein